MEDVIINILSGDSDYFNEDKNVRVFIKIFGGQKSVEEIPINFTEFSKMNHLKTNLILRPWPHYLRP